MDNHSNTSEPTIYGFFVIPAKVPASLLPMLCSALSSIQPLAQPPATPMPKPVPHEPTLLEQAVPPKSPAKGGGRNGPATPGQLKFIRGVAKKQGIEEEDIAMQYGVPRLENLTNGQASDWLETH